MLTPINAATGKRALLSCDAESYGVIGKLAAVTMRNNGMAEEWS